MDRTYYLLSVVAGHNIVNAVVAGSMREVKSDILPGFKLSSDDGKVKIVLDPEEAKKWEASCYHVRGKESE